MRDEVTLHLIGTPTERQDDRRPVLHLESREVTDRALGDRRLRSRSISCGSTMKNSVPKTFTNDESAMKVFMSGSRFVEFLAIDLRGDLPGDLPIHQTQELEFGRDLGQIALHQGLSISFEPSAISVVWANSTVSSRALVTMPDEQIVTARGSAER